jgi:hypothetical protein
MLFFDYNSVKFFKIALAISSEFALSRSKNEL